MNDFEQFLSINTLNDSLNKHPEYKLLSHLNFSHFYDYSQHECKNSVIKEFILQNENVFQGEEFTDILNFTIFNFICQFEKTDSKEIFIQIFHNLKLFISININSEELPLFFFQIIYKSLLYMNKLIIDFQKFFKQKGENSLNYLVEILEFMPNLFNLLKFLDSEDSLKSDAINQIKIIYDLLINANTNYNKTNKIAIAFYLEKANPFLIPKRKKNFQNIVHMEIEDCIDVKIQNKQICDNNEYTFNNIEQNNSVIINFDSFISNSKSNVIDNSGSNITDVSMTKNLKGHSISSDSLLEEKKMIKEEELDEKNLIDKCSNVKDKFSENQKESGNLVIHNQSYNSFSKLSSKVKKFSENHFDIENFRKRFLSIFDIHERDIHSMLETVAVNLFDEVKVICKLEKSNLELKNLKKEFQLIFKNYKLYLIGSLGCDIFSNLPGRTSIDFLLLPIENNSENYFLNIEEFLDGITDYNKNSLDYNFTLNSEQNEQTLMDFTAAISLYSKKNDKYFNANFFIHKEKLKFTHDYFSAIFSTCENLKILHSFLQEILITKIGFCCFRWDISVTILSFLEFYKQIFKKNEQILSFESLHPQNSNNYKSSKLVLDKESYFYFQIDKNKLDEIGKISVGELILEFFRYFLNYLTYIKNKFNNNKCKGFDKLQKIFEMEYLRNKGYLYYHEYIEGFYSLNQEDFINEFMKRYSKMEEIFFIICENSKYIKRYSDIILNITEIDD